MTVAADQNRSARTDVRGQTRGIKLLASTCSPGVHPTPTCHLVFTTCGDLLDVLTPHVGFSTQHEFGPPTGGRVHLVQHRVFVIVKEALIVPVVCDGANGRRLSKTALSAA